jgi:hypothetical protein
MICVPDDIYGAGLRGLNTIGGYGLTRPYGIRAPTISCSDGIRLHYEIL